MSGDDTNSHRVSIYGNLLVRIVGERHRAIPCENLNKDGLIVSHQ